MNKWVVLHTAAGGTLRKMSSTCASAADAQSIGEALVRSGQQDVQLCEIVPRARIEQPALIITPIMEERK